MDELHGAACFVVDELQAVGDRSGSIRAYSGADFADDLAALRVERVLCRYAVLCDCFAGSGSRRRRR